MIANNSWGGRFFEDFKVGDKYQHPGGKTIIDADNVWFTLLTMNTHPVHFNYDYAEKTEFGRPLVNSCLTLSLVTGMSVGDLSQNAVSNLGWENVRLSHPLFIGDTLYAESEIIEKRESKSKSYAGIVKAKTKGIKQDGTVVIEYERIFLVYKKGCAPKIDRGISLHSEPIKDC